MLKYLITTHFFIDNNFALNNTSAHPLPKEKKEINGQKKEKDLELLLLVF